MKKPHFAIRLPNWLGDVIMTLPSLEALNRAGFTFELLGKPWIKDLFSAYPYRCHAIPNNLGDTRRLYQAMGTSHAILFTNGLSSVLPLVGTGIKSIGYYRSNLRRILLSRAKLKPTGLHEIEHFWQLTQFAVNKPLPIPENPKLVIADSYQKQADKLLKKHRIQKKFFVICPGAMGHGVKNQSKIWPHWQNLCKRLSQQGISLVACPAPFETQPFEDAFGEHVLMLPNLNLPMYAAILQRATQVIANDSGPMHLAAAVQAPVLGIFGQSDPQRTQPWGGYFIGNLNHWPSCEEVLSSVTSIQPQLL